MQAPQPRTQLLGLLRTHSVKRGDFILSSGQRSEYYLDARLVTLSGEGSPLVGRVFVDALAGLGVDAVAGLAIGADPIVTAIAVVSGIDGRPIDALIVRKETKQHGVGGRIVGPWRIGRRIAVVDDTFTTGSSALAAAAAIEEDGGQVAGIVALIDREQGARETIEKAGYSFHVIFRGVEVLDGDV